MTRERAKELLPVITAFAEGKEVEYQSGTSDWTENPSPSWSEHCQYRIKPEPRLRPWKPEEVPVGAILRRTKLTPNEKETEFEGDLVTTILSSSGLGFQYAGGKGISFIGHGSDVWDKLKEYCEHSTDGGRTWSPCGVLETP